MKRLNRMGLLVCVLGLILWAGLPAFSQPKNPCTDDLARFCAEVKPGGGRLLKCLTDHESLLSVQCKAGIEETRAKIREGYEPCGDDIHKLCQDVRPGGGRIVKCLKEHEDQLTPECLDNLSRHSK